jgi:hypothetical protein
VVVKGKNTYPCWKSNPYYPAHSLLCTLTELLQLYKDISKAGEIRVQEIEVEHSKYTAFVTECRSANCD